MAQILHNLGKWSVIFSIVAFLIYLLIVIWVPAWFDARVFYTLGTIFPAGIASMVIADTL